MIQAGLPVLTPREDARHLTALPRHFVQGQAVRVEIGQGTIGRVLILGRQRIFLFEPLQLGGHDGLHVIHGGEGRLVRRGGLSHAARMTSALYADWIEITIERDIIAHVRLGCAGPEHDGEDHTVAHFVLPRAVINDVVQRWVNLSNDTWRTVEPGQDGLKTAPQVIRVNFSQRLRIDP